MKMHFIKTSDSTTAVELRNAGLEELQKEGEFFVFINNEKLNFSENKKIVYTNKLNFRYTERSSNG